jgi:hypothetical protein
MGSAESQNNSLLDVDQSGIEAVKVEEDEIKGSRMSRLLCALRFDTQ